MLLLYNSQCAPNDNTRHNLHTLQVEERADEDEAFKDEENPLLRDGLSLSLSKYVNPTPYAHICIYECIHLYIYVYVFVCVCVCVSCMPP
jgi:hypothetical protein